MPNRGSQLPESLFYNTSVIVFAIILASLSMIAGSALSFSGSDQGAGSLSSFLSTKVIVVMPAVIFVILVAALIEIFGNKSIPYFGNFRSSLRKRLQKQKSADEYQKAEFGAFLAVFILLLVVIFVVLQIQMTSIKAFNAILIAVVLLVFSFIGVWLVRSTGYSLLQSALYAVPIGIVLGYLA